MALNRTDFGRFHSGQSKELLRALEPVSDLLSAEVAVTASAAEINTLDNPELLTPAGAGITSGTGTIYENSVRTIGGIKYTTIIVDLTGLGSSTTDLDIIGVGASPAHLGQLSLSQSGTIFGGTMTCLEAPLTGVTDIDLYAADEGTGVFDAGIGTLVETALITNGAAWTIAMVKAIAQPPATAQYLYLTCGAAGTVGTYTAGKFKIELMGY